MPRTKRVTPGGMVFHALNCGVGKMRIFSTEQDYAAFEETIEETLRLYPMRILAYCLMSPHWHFVLWPEGGEDLFAFLQRLTNAHAQRGQRAKSKVGFGHLYQGRFMWFRVETDDYFDALLRYVERNALRAKLVETFVAAANAAAPMETATGCNAGRCPWSWSPRSVPGASPESWKNGPPAKLPNLCS